MAARRKAALERVRAAENAAGRRRAPHGRLLEALLAGLLLLAAVPSARAQTAPDVGTLLRSFGAATTPSPTPFAPLEAEPKAPIRPSAGPTVLVEGFRIRATAFPERVLQAVLRDYVGRKLTFAGLEEAALRISEYYWAHDLFAHAYLPPQKIENGIVEIDVLEARLGKVTAAKGTDLRIDPDLAAGLVAARAGVGSELRPSALAEGISVLQGATGVKAEPVLSAGSGKDETDATLKLTEPPLVSGMTEVDDEGARWIGRKRAIGVVTLNDPLGRGDQFSLATARTADSWYGRAAAQAPAGTSGLVLGVNASILDYALEGPFEALREQGGAWTAGATAAYPIRRSEAFSLTSFGSLDFKRLSTEILGQTSSDRAIESSTLGLASTFKDGWAGVDGLTGAVTVGNLARGADAADREADALTSRSEGEFTKLSFAATRLQPLPHDLGLYTALSGQMSDANLDPAEKFSLGGPEGVRAYPVGEADGDWGTLATVELRHHPLKRLEVAGFYDVGAVRQNEQPWEGWQTVAGEPNTYMLQGVGARATWTPIDRLQTTLTVAQALGSNPGHDADGANSDGGHDRTEVWLEVRILF